MAWSPLRMRLTLATAVLSSLMLVVVGLMLERVLAANLLRDVDGRLARQARQLGELIVEATRDDGMPGDAVASLADRVVAPGIVAKLITPDGNVQILVPGRSAASFPDAPSLIAAGRAGQTTSTTVQVASGDDLRLLVMPVANEPQTMGVLVVGESLVGMHTSLSTVRTVLLLAGILTVLLLTGGLGLVIGRALAPMHTLTRRTADIVASENYRNRVALPARRDEIHQLAATINDLIAAVQRTLDQKRQFLAFTSHELRSPLTVILANLDLLRRDLTPTERALSVAEATEEARRMRRLVNDLLLLAEKDSTRVVERTPMRLDSLIEETVAVTVREAETHRVHVEIETPVVVEGDPERLMQVVRNLVENALMHTPAGTLVEVRLTQAQGYAHITVADNGPGIPPEHLPHLWDRFYRVDQARSRAQGSTGLGLPIVKYLAEAHGGSVTVSSTPGYGTTFTVLVPLAPQQKPSAPATVAAATV